MKALHQNAYGGPEVLSLKDAPRPQIAENEILVRVTCAPVSQADVMMRRGVPRFARLMLGLRRPRSPIPGTGFAGQVAEVGRNVTAFAPGDRVFGETALGFATHAEYVAVPETGLIVKSPDGASDTQLAALCDGALTSYNFLHRLAGLRPGDRVLVNGASGGLGTAAVQIAKAGGAIVTGVCSGPNMGLVTRLGADRVLDRTACDVIAMAGPQDIVFDTVGKLGYARARRILAPGGRYLSPVLGLGLLLRMLATHLSGDRRALFQATGLQKHDVLRPMLRRLAAMVAAGQLTEVTDRIWPLEHAGEAHAHVETGHKVGNVILRIADSQPAPRAA